MAYLARQADENPVAFMGLLSKVLPTEVAQEPRPSANIGEIRLVPPDFEEVWDNGGISARLALSTR